MKIELEEFPNSVAIESIPAFAYGLDWPHLTKPGESEQSTETLG